MSRTVRLGCITLLLLAVGCDRRLEPWVDAGDEPPPPERPVRIPALRSPVARTGPPMQPRSSAAAPSLIKSGPGIRGVLELAPGTRASGGVLFLIARTTAVGPPLAVVRLPPGPFPMPFEIGPGDVMLPGVPFAGDIRLSARIDSDGDPLTRSDADLSAEAAAPVRPGTSDVVLTLAGR